MMAYSMQVTEESRNEIKEKLENCSNEEFNRKFKNFPLQKDRRDIEYEIENGENISNILLISKYLGIYLVLLNIFCTNCNKYCIADADLSETGSLIYWIFCRSCGREIEETNEVYSEKESLFLFDVDPEEPEDFESIEEI